MKAKLFITALAMAAVAVSCRGGDDEFSLNDTGSINLQCSAASEITAVETRAASGYALPSSVIPSRDVMKLRITGSYMAGGVSQEFDQTWSSVKSYETEDPKFNFGTYKATIWYGDLDQEGANKPYFYGESGDISVATTRPTSASVTAALKNSCFTVSFGEWLKNYYKDIVIKISTTNNVFSFNQYSASEDVANLIFIKPSQQLRISGSAVKTQTNTAVEFPVTIIGGGLLVEPETKYTISIDHSTAGGETISIGFDGTFTDVTPVDVELNPEV